MTDISTENYSTKLFLQQELYLANRLNSVSDARNSLADSFI